MGSSKIDTFDKYREVTKALRLEFIRHALSMLSNAEYPNITRLARDVAKIVAELESSRKTGSPDAAGQDTSKPISHVTLLRNVSYRVLLEKFMKVESKSDSLPGQVLTELEAVRIRNASLESQIHLLKEKIRGIDLLGDRSKKISSMHDEDAFAELIRSVSLLFKFLDGMVSQAADVYRTVLEGQETPMYKEPGFYGPWEKIASLDELRQLEKIRVNMRRLESETCVRL